MISNKIGKLLLSRQLLGLRKMSGVSHHPISQEKPGEYKNLMVTSPKEFVYHVELNRPKKLNAFNFEFWMEIKKCFEELAENSDCRVIVLSAIGKHFGAGIDLSDMVNLGQELGAIDDVARKGVVLGRKIKMYQDSISSLELCSKPVIAAVHSACIGAALDLITAADIRYCSQCSFFQVKEVDIGMAADVGVLQRLPKIIGSQSLARELCFSARRIEATEALNCGLVSKVLADKNETVQAALHLAASIAEKSPIAVQATKANIIYSLDRTNQEGLDHIRELNKLYLQSEDFLNAATAQLVKGEKPVFSKL